MLLGSEKVNKYLFTNPIVKECNEMLQSCKTKEDRMKAATLIRSKTNRGFPGNIFLNKGIKGYLY